MGIRIGKDAHSSFFGGVVVIKADIRRSQCDHDGGLLTSLNCVIKNMWCFGYDEKKGWKLSQVYMGYKDESRLDT